MKQTGVLFAVLVLMAAAAYTQQPKAMPLAPPSVDHTPVTCVMGGEMPVFNVAVNREGILRAFFRRVGATDWCSVDGTNLLKLSTVTLPKFETGDEFEYYFVLIDGKRIIAKSPQIFRTRAEVKCETPFTRHAVLVTMQCLPPGANPMATAAGAGFALTSNGPGVQSPEKPSQATASKGQ
jgi:hypothetical protein